MFPIQNKSTPRTFSKPNEDGDLNAHLQNGFDDFGGLNYKRDDVKNGEDGG